MKFVNNSSTAADMDGQISDMYIPGIFKLYHFIAGEV